MAAASGPTTQLERDNNHLLVSSSHDNNNVLGMKKQNNNNNFEIERTNAARLRARPSGPWAAGGGDSPPTLRNNVATGRPRSKNSLLTIGLVLLLLLSASGGFMLATMVINGGGGGAATTRMRGGETKLMSGNVITMNNNGVDEQQHAMQDQNSSPITYTVPLPPPVPPLPPLPTTSVIASCKNRADTLSNTLPSWLLANGVGEVILVDWSSDPPLLPTVTSVTTQTHLAAPHTKSIPVKLVIVQNETQWILSHAFNLALAHVRYPITFKVDCDYALHSDVLTANPIQHDSNFFYTGNWRQAKNENDLHLNGALLVRTDMMRRVGGYDERIQTYGWDDTDMYSRLQRVATRKDVAQGSITHLSHADSMRTKIADVFSSHSPPSQQLLEHVTSFPTLQTQLNRLFTEKSVPWNNTLATTVGSRWTSLPNNNNNNHQYPLYTSRIFKAHQHVDMFPKATVEQLRLQIAIWYLRKHQVPKSIWSVLRPTEVGRLALDFYQTAERLRRDHPKAQVNGTFPIRLIIIDVQNGLGNRLRTMTSGIAFATTFYRVPMIMWIPNVHCQAKYSDLFDQDSFRHVVLDTAIDQWPFKPWTFRGFQLYNLLEGEEEQGRRAGLKFISRRQLAPKNFLIHPSSSKHAYLRSPNIVNSVVPLKRTITATFKQLTPLPEVVNMLKHQCPLDVSSRIGIHMRVKSLADDIAGVKPEKEYTQRFLDGLAKYKAKSSNVTLFYLAMRKEWHKNDHKKFVVASDSVNAIHQLIEMATTSTTTTPRSESAIFWNKDACSERNTECIRTALVELICLSRTEGVIGSGWSSFTEVTCRMSPRKSFFVQIIGFDRSNKADSTNC